MIAFTTALLLAAYSAEPPKCVGHSDCTEAEACVVGICLARCSDTNPCARGNCGPAGPPGLKVCFVASDAAPPTSTATDRQPGRPCESSTDCEGGEQVCLEKVCRYSCNSDADCMKGTCSTTAKGYTICPEELDVRPARKTKGWSIAGWDHFKFGMGQDDVLEAAGNSARFVPTFSEGRPREIDAYFLEGWTAPEIGGVGMTLWFGFLRGRLYEISLLPSWPDHTYNDRRLEHFFHLEALLTEKYGPPAKRSVPKNTTIGDIASGRRPFSVTWAKKGLEISLKTVSSSDRDIEVALNYSDPKGRRDASALFGKEALDRINRERDRL